MALTPMTVVETAAFLERAKGILSESQRADLVAYLASNPEAGRVIPGTGGARKLRWAISGRGKRGGARTIYYYHNQSIPLFVLDIYAKSERSNLSEADKRSLKRLLAQIPSRYAGGERS
jgi:RelE toxin of RelE / RelB toxin-antitoxin system